MRTRYKAVGVDGPYFVTSTVVEWIPVFTAAKYCDLITGSLDYCRNNKQLSLHAYVIMDNHIHLVLSAPDVTTMMRDVKSYTSKTILQLLQRDEKSWLLTQLEHYKKEYKYESVHQIWQEGFHPQLLTPNEMLQQKVDYLHHNPVRRGLVSSPEHWVYSSASNYHAGTGIIGIDRLS